jgi:uncharacterized FAD-dependent dehydrogenase
MDEEEEEEDMDVVVEEGEVAVGVVVDTEVHKIDSVDDFEKNRKINYRVEWDNMFRTLCEENYIKYI